MKIGSEGLDSGMYWTDGRKQDFVGKTKIEKIIGVIRNEHGQVRIMGNQSVMAEQ